jgi:hypothetical protein
MGLDISLQAHNGIMEMIENFTGEQYLFRDILYCMLKRISLYGNRKRHGSANPENFPSHSTCHRYFAGHNLRDQNYLGVQNRMSSIYQA